jgi:predicted Zn-dependent protease
MLALGLLLASPASAAAVSPPAAAPCPPASRVRVLEPEQAPAPPPAAANPGDYRDRLKPTPLGWPRRHHWCVWVEPPQGSGAERVWQRLWLTAVQAALVEWQRHLPITLVEDPGRAQVRLHRLRPPLLGEGLTRRASHGRALLQLVEVERQGELGREPRVEVLISPGQRPEAMQATALHELGHAFGLWGHSDRSGDAMAAVPGPAPVLVLSERDLATLRWLQAQPALGSPAAGALPLAP